MFAFFGLGWGELVILGLMGGVVAIVTLVVVMASRAAAGKPRDLNSEIDDLHDEVARLRKAIDRLLAKADAPPDDKQASGPDTGIRET